MTLHTETEQTKTRTQHGAKRRTEGLEPTPQPPLRDDLESRRERAVRHMQRGAVTDSYGADPETVVEVLNGALATEIVCMLRYKRHHYMARGAHAEAAAAEFEIHAREESEHADRLAARIVQLGGEPDFDPAGLTERAHAQYRAGHDLASMIQENLIAERIAIESYQEMIRFLGNDDPTTRRVLEDILAAEEEHADDMLGFLEAVQSEEQ